MIPTLLEPFSRLCISNSRMMLTVAGLRPSVISSLLPNSQNSPFLSVNQVIQSQQTRSINKHGYQNEPGWKAIGYRYLVKFPEDGKYTLKKLTVNKLAGRDPNTGRVTVGGLGGGCKQKWRWVDTKRHANPDGTPLVERVLNIQYDPCRTPRIALVASGTKARYITATSTMKIGDLITTSSHIPRIAIRPKEADAHPLGALPVGTEICLIEKYVGEGAHIAVNAGSRAILSRKVGDRCIITMPSKQEVSLRQECMAVVGHVSNEEHSSIPIGSPWRLRWLGHRPRSGLWHRKDGRHGRKIRPLPPVKVAELKPKMVVETLPLTINVESF